MRIMAIFIALISFVLMIMNWDTALAIAWGVAFSGWLPHTLGNDTQETDHGHRA